MFLHCWPFWWPWQSAGAIQSASPNEHVQGYSGSHWTPPSGDYPLRIAPAAARVTGKQTTINKYTYKACHFDGHGNAPEHNCTHCPMEEVQGFTRSHWMLPLGEYYVSTWKGHGYNVFFMFFIVKTVGKSHGSMLRPLYLIGVWNIKRKRRA